MVFDAQCQLNFGVEGARELKKKRRNQSRNKSAIMEGLRPIWFVADSVFYQLIGALESIF